MEFVQFLGVLRRWWKVLLLGIIVGVAMSLLFVHEEQPMYQSSTRLFIDQVQVPGPVTLNDVQTSQQLTKTYSELLRSRPILTQTIARLNLPFTPENLDARLIVTPVRDTQILQVSVKDTDAERAATTVNGLSQVFITYVQDLRAGKLQAALQQIDRDIDAVQAQMTDTSSRLNQLRTNIGATSATALELQRLQQVLSQYDQDLRDIRQHSADISSRINDLRTAPGPTTASSAEIQRLQDQLAQYDKDAENIRARYTDTSNRLDQLRNTTVTGPVAQGDAQRLQEQLTQYEDKYRRLIDTRQSITIAQTQNGGSVIVSNPAQIPTAPIPSHAELKLPLAGSIGLLLALAIALLIEYFDDRMRDPSEMRQRFGIVPLAVLGFRRRRRVRMSAKATRNTMVGFEDALRTLRTNLRFMTSNQSAVICITSALDREGKSSVAMNLALLEAETEKRVILIDANFRHPTLHRQLGLTNDEGLSTFLATPQGDHEPTLQDGPHGVKVLTSGPAPPDPCDLLASVRMVELIDMLRARADMIILDTAAILPVPDTLALQQLVDGTLVIVDMRRTGRKTLEELFSALEMARAKILGAVLNKANRRAPRRGYSHASDHDRRYRFGKRPLNPAMPQEQSEEDVDDKRESALLVSKTEGDEGQDRGLDRI
jgi:polysaccharide biosynthesis transport protein